MAGFSGNSGTISEKCPFIVVNFPQEEIYDTVMLYTSSQLVAEFVA